MARALCVWAVRLMLLEVAIMLISDARDYAAQNEWIMPDYARVCDYARIMLMGNYAKTLIGKVVLKKPEGVVMNTTGS